DCSHCILSALDRMQRRLRVAMDFPPSAVVPYSHRRRDRWTDWVSRRACEDAQRVVLASTLSGFRYSVWSRPNTPICSETVGRERLNVPSGRGVPCRCCATINQWALTPEFGVPVSETVWLFLIRCLRSCDSTRMENHLSNGQVTILVRI